MNNAQLFNLVMTWALVSSLLLILIVRWNPHAIRIALAKRLVWVCDADGELTPVKATLDSLAYKTKNHGIFEFGREDVVRYGNKPGIIVYAPYSQAVRPQVLPAIQALKKYGIERYDQMMAILSAQEMTPAEFKKFQSQEAKQ
ncbi:hypothetical protein [Methanolobus sp. ZRKC5]|uniref:hypothetical protein n=1 Tax=unclassified Methanolobus TaxID=2629569 RepID=UPI00313CCE83